MVSQHSPNTFRQNTPKGVPKGGLVAVSGMTVEFEDLPYSSRFVMRRDNMFRQVWNLSIGVLLIYTGTFFIYRISFIDFRIPPDGGPRKETTKDGWDYFDQMVYVFFVLDLVLGFFMSYQEHNREIVDVKVIARQYLRSTFVINFVACVPTELIEALAESSGGHKSHDWNQAFRILRLERLSRILRLTRFLRLAKLGRRVDRFTRVFQSHKAARALNLLGGLIWLVHLCACGWYLAAAMQDEGAETWVQRRGFDLIQKDPYDNWMQSMYFVFTVFTTVGFGDMSALTNLEIVYVCLLMMLGAIVHSIIISEVITVVLSKDRIGEFVEKERDLIESFADHTELSDNARELLNDWIYSHAQQWFKQQYAKDDVKQLLTGKYMPRRVLGRLPGALFDGELLKNRLFSAPGCKTPPRLPILFAVCLTKSGYRSGDIVYEVHDYPFNVFLVFRGVFAFVADPGQPQGNAVSKAEALQEMVVEVEKSKSAGPQQAKNATDHLSPYMYFAKGNYFGEMEVFKTCPRLTNARCESSEGTLLSIQRGDLRQLMEEFPEFGRQWMRHANSREAVRRTKRCEVIKGATVMNMAAKTITESLRRLSQQRKNELCQMRPAASSAARQSRCLADHVLSVAPKIAAGQLEGSSFFEGGVSPPATFGSQDAASVIAEKVDMLDDKIGRLTSVVNLLASKIGINSTAL